MIFAAENAESSSGKERVSSRDGKRTLAVREWNIVFPVFAS